MNDSIGENTIKVGQKCKDIGTYGFYMIAFTLILAIVYFLIAIISKANSYLALHYKILGACVSVGVLLIGLYLIGNHLMCIGKIEFNTRADSTNNVLQIKKVKNESLRIMAIISLVIAILTLVTLFIPLTVYETKETFSAPSTKIVGSGMVYMVRWIGGKINNDYEKLVGVATLFHTIMLLGVIIWDLIRVVSPYNLKSNVLATMSVVVCFILNFFYVIFGIVFVSKKGALYLIPLLLNVIFTILYIVSVYVCSRNKIEYNVCK